MLSKELVSGLSGNFFSRVLQKTIVIVNMWVELADQAVVSSTGVALEGRCFHVEFLNNKQEALERLKNLVPLGAEVMTGSSTTLKEIGFVDFLSSGKHSRNNLKEKIVSEKILKNKLKCVKKVLQLNIFKKCSRHYAVGATNHC